MIVVKQCWICQGVGGFNSPGEMVDPPKAKKTNWGVVNKPPRTALKSYCIQNDLNNVQVMDLLVVVILSLRLVNNCALQICCNHLPEAIF